MKNSQNAFYPLLKFLLLTCVSICCISVSAQGATPEQVAKECNRQMSAGICITRPDRSTIAPGQTMLLSGVGRVSYSAYLDYLDLYNPKVPTDPAMCKLALNYMNTQPGGDHDKIARALWTPSPEALASERTEQLTEFGAKAALFIIIGLVITLVARRMGNKKRYPYRS